MKTIEDFVRESNAIEGILRDPTKAEIKEFNRFLSLSEITIDDLKKFLSVYQPDARLRDRLGLDVRVGNHFPPIGGPTIRARLQSILDNLPITGSYISHQEYEQLHPFTDGNGRSGRALWAWQKGDLSLGFLHAFYYQSLSHYRIPT